MTSVGGIGRHSNRLHNYAPQDLDQALHFLQHAGEKYPFKELIGAEYSLNDINRATQAAEAGKALRVAVRGWD